MRGAGAGSGTAEMFRAGVLIGSGEVLVWGARTGQWAYRPFPAIRFRRNLAGRQMPNTTGLILASTTAVDCQLNPALTRGISFVGPQSCPAAAHTTPIGAGLMDAHLDRGRPVLPHDPGRQRSRMGRLLPRRIVPSVTLRLAVVLDAHGEHTHHAPCGLVARKPRAGCRVLRGRDNRRFSSTLLSRWANPGQEAPGDRSC